MINLENPRNVLTIILFISNYPIKSNTTSYDDLLDRITIKFNNDYEKVFVSDAVFSKIRESEDNNLYIKLSIIDKPSKIDNDLENIINYLESIYNIIKHDIWIFYHDLAYVINGGLSLKYANITSPNFDEINRTDKITITEHDANQNKFKCNISDIKVIKEISPNKRPWFIAQGSEASSYCEILNIDDDGWIYYSTPMTGSMDFAVGETIEFFNPFINYKILNNESPTLAVSQSDTNTFSGYPTTLNGKDFRYLVNAGLIKKKSDNKYRVYLSAVGSGETFIAEDININGNFKLVSEIPFLDTIQFPSEKPKGDETILWGVVPVTDPHVLKTGIYYFGLLSVKSTDNLNYVGIIYLNEDGELFDSKLIEIKLFKDIDPNLHLTGLAFYDNKYHFILKKWGTGNKLTNYSYHCISNNVTETNTFFDIIKSTDSSILSKKTKLHQGSENNRDSIFYGQGDFNLFIYGENLHMFYYIEPLKTGFVNTNNRMCGIALWNSKTLTWNYQNGMQLINPVQLFRKYPNLLWCFDHWGNLNNPYFENGNMYLGTTIASDNPDYFPAIIKLNINS